MPRRDGHQRGVIADPQGEPATRRGIRRRIQAIKSSSLLKNDLSRMTFSNESPPGSLFPIFSLNFKGKGGIVFEVDNKAVCPSERTGLMYAYRRGTEE